MKKILSYLVLGIFGFSGFFDPSVFAQKQMESAPAPLSPASRRTVSYTETIYQTITNESDFAPFTLNNAFTVAWGLNDFFSLMVYGSGSIASPHYPFEDNAIAYGGVLTTQVMFYVDGKSPPLECILNLTGYLQGKAVTSSTVSSIGKNWQMFSWNELAAILKVSSKIDAYGFSANCFSSGSTIFMDQIIVKAKLKMMNSIGIDSL